MTALDSQRHLFDVPPEVAYFNAAYNSPLLDASAEALVQGARSKRHPWERKAADFFDDAEAFRRLAARAFGGSSECYAVIPSASYGTSAVARILEDHLNPRDEIVVVDEEFPSNYLPWHRLARVTGATIVTAPKPADDDWTSSVLSRIHAETALVAVPNCHWSNGAVLDLIAVSEASRAVGATLVLEVTQSLGAMPLDLERINPDFMIASGYKWLLFPYGLSLFFAAPHWHHAQPLEETWLNREGAQIFETLSDHTEAYQPGARRFDMGQKCIPSLLPGGLVALRQIGDWGVERIAARLKEFNDRIADVLTDCGLIPVARAFRSPHILGASAPGRLPEHLIPALAERKIYISRRGDALRFAPHLHVSDYDVDRLCHSLTELLPRSTA